MKLTQILLTILIMGSSFLSLGQSVGSNAPDFTIYEYKDKEFSLSENIGKKVITLVFGSIT